MDSAGKEQTQKIKIMLQSNISNKRGGTCTAEYGTYNKKFLTLSGYTLQNGSSQLTDQPLQHMLL